MGKQSLAAYRAARERRMSLDPHYLGRVTDAWKASIRWKDKPHARKVSRVTKPRYKRRGVHVFIKRHRGDDTPGIAGIGANAGGTTTWKAFGRLTKCRGRRVFRKVKAKGGWRKPSLSLTAPTRFGCAGCRTN